MQRHTGRGLLVTCHYHYKYYVIARVTSPYLSLALSSEAVMSNFANIIFIIIFSVSIVTL